VNKLTKIEYTYGTEIEMHNGMATFVTKLTNAEDKPIAQEIYNNIINNYENQPKNKSHYFGLLWY